MLSSIPVHRRQWQVGLCESETILVYMVSSRLGRATWDHVTNKNKSFIVYYGSKNLNEDKRSGAAWDLCFLRSPQAWHLGCFPPGMRSCSSQPTYRWFTQSSTGMLHEAAFTNGSLSEFVQLTFSLRACSSQTLPVSYCFMSSKEFLPELSKAWVLRYCSFLFRCSASICWFPECEIWRKEGHGKQMTG